MSSVSTHLTCWFTDLCLMHIRITAGLWATILTGFLVLRRIASLLSHTKDRLVLATVGSCEGWLCGRVTEIAWEFRFSTSTRQQLPSFNHIETDVCDTPHRWGWCRFDSNGKNTQNIISHVRYNNFLLVFISYLNIRSFCSVLSFCIVDRLLSAYQVRHLAVKGK